MSMNGHISLGGYLKPMTAKITVRESIQLFEEQWRAHEAALLAAFERRFQLVEARLQAQITGIPLDEQQFVAETQPVQPMGEMPEGDLS